MQNIITEYITSIFKIIWYSFHEFFTVSLWNLVCSLYLTALSHITSVQYPHLSSSFYIRQCSLRKSEDSSMGVVIDYNFSSSSYYSGNKQPAYLLLFLNSSALNSIFPLI